MGAPARSEGRGRRTAHGSVLAILALGLVAFSSAAPGTESPEDAEPTPAPVLDEPLRHFEHLDASRSLVEILPLLPGLDGAEHAIGRFLAGVAFFELGLDSAADRELSSVLDDLQIGGAARVALARVRSRTGRTRALLALARTTAFETLPEEDRAELAWRAARAAFARGRFREADGWIDRIPRGTGYDPFGAYLRAQAAFAAGRPAAAIEAAEGLLAGAARGNPTLRDRTAILLGDLYTEAGRYDQAVRVLATPRDDGPFAARAKRDRLVAEGLARLAAGEFADAAPVVERVGRYLDALSTEVAAAVSTPAAVEARLAELRGSWPPRFAVYARREWATHHARRALDAIFERRGAGGLYGALVRFAGLAGDVRHRHGGDPWLPPREPVTRFFYPPQGELDSLLRALALLEEPVAFHGDACRLRAAVAIRERVARGLLGEAEPPDRGELNVLAGGCGEAAGATDGLARATRASIAERIEAEAEAVRDRYRRDRLELELAIGRAWSRYLDAVERSRREAKSRGSDGPVGRP